MLTVSKFKMEKPKISYIRKPGSHRNRRLMEDITNTWSVKVFSEPEQHLSLDKSTQHTSEDSMSQTLQLSEQVESLQLKLNTLSKRFRHKETEHQQLLAMLEESQSSTQSLEFKLKETTADLERSGIIIQDLKAKIREISDSDTTERIIGDLNLRKEIDSLRTQLEIAKEEKDSLLEAMHRDREPLNQKVMNAIAQFANMMYSKIGISSMDPKLRELLRELIGENHISQVQRFEEKLNSVKNQNKMLSQELFKVTESLNNAFEQVLAIKDPSLRESTEYEAIRNSQKNMNIALRESKAVICLAARLAEDVERDDPQQVILKLRKRVAVLEEEIRSNRDQDTAYCFLAAQATALEDLLNR